MGVGGLRDWQRRRRRRKLVEQYLRGGRVAWGPGYREYRIDFLRDAASDASLLRRFGSGAELPKGYARGLDERAVEYPWVLARLDDRAGLLLDAGSTLNYPYLQDLPQLSSKKIVILTLAPEATMLRSDRVSYMFGDLRQTILRDRVFDYVVCISTLEHVGLDNTRLYTEDVAFRENSGDFRDGVKELARVLRPGGRLLLTVPFGRAENHGWLQQFDAAGLATIEEAFGRAPSCRSFYRYGADGWQGVMAEECSDCSYFDVHAAEGAASDGAAAARAVACIEFRKEA